MPKTADQPADAVDVSAWLLRNATEAEDGKMLLDQYGHALNAAGLPIVRLSVGLPALNPRTLGISLTWWRNRGTTVFTMAHGPVGEAEFQRDPIGALVAEGRNSARWRVAENEGCDTFPLLAELREAGVTEYLLHMVRFASDIAIKGTGLAFATDRPGGFSNRDITIIEAQWPALGLAVYRICLSRTMYQVLGAYVGPMTAARVLNGSIRRGRGEVMSAAILLVDLKGFTTLADREEPLRVVAWLDQHLDALGSGIEAQGGEILKFTGDGFLAVFPVVDLDAAPCEICAGALDAVRRGLAANQALEVSRRAAGEPWLAADLVLHFGEVVYGNVGTANRLDFTAIGRAVNEASRIEVLCDTTNCNVLLSDSFARRCAVPLIDLGVFRLRGVDVPQRLWTIGPS